MPRHANDFREREEKVPVGELLTEGRWYRTPLSNYDHLLGCEREWADDEIAWCGMAIGYARDMDDRGQGDSLGGLWVSTRKGGKCAYCRRRQQEWLELIEYTAKIG